MWKAVLFGHFDFDKSRYFLTFGQKAHNYREKKIGDLCGVAKIFRIYRSAKLCARRYLRLRFEDFFAAFDLEDFDLLAVAFERFEDFFTGA